MVTTLIPEGKQGNQVKIWITIAVVALIIIVAIMIIKRVFGGLDKFLEAIGLKDSKNEEETNQRLSTNAEAARLSTSPWSPLFYKSAPAGSTIPTSVTAQKIAKQLYDSVGFISDDPEEGLSAIKQVKTQAGVSYVVDTFNSLYRADLYTWLEMHYDTAQQKYVLIRIADFVNSLPKYKI